MADKICIGLVEDQVLFRQGMKSLLNSWPEFEVVFESGDGFSVMGKLQRAETLPDVMLVDLSLPADGHREYSGLDLTLDLKEHFPSVKVLILSVNDDEYFISRLIEKGADGYLVKDSDPREVRDAIQAMHHNGSYINARALKAIQARLGGKVKPQKNLDALSPREIDVLKLTCQQLTAEEIGEKLFISPKTVNGHRNNLLQKTGSRNVTGLVMYAIKHKIVEVI